MRFGDFELNEEPKDTDGVEWFLSWGDGMTNMNLNGKPLTAELMLNFHTPLPPAQEIRAMHYIGRPIVQSSVMPVITDMIADLEKDLFAAQINVAEEENLRFLAIVRRNNL